MLAAALAATGLFCAAASAQETIGIAAPLSGPMAILGEQVRRGAEVAADRAGLRLAVADDSCTAEGGRRAAEEFVRQRVRIVVGFLCAESIEAALPILTQASIAAITVGVRTNGLTDRKTRTGWPVYRLAPRADAELDAVARILTRLWQGALFAIVDDGTIHARELSESLRAAAEQAGLRPVLVETFRPQLENQTALIARLRRAGATRVFVGGDRDDVAIMSRDAAEGTPPLVFAGGETLRARGDGPPLAEGTIMIALPEGGLAADAAAAFAAQGIAPEGYAPISHAAVEIAAAALTAAGPVALEGRRFSTALGPVTFDAKGDLAENPYRAFRFDGKDFQRLELP
jgi:branched-chain amino acid transport system substrate-binding protein